MGGLLSPPASLTVVPIPLTVAQFIAETGDCCLAVNLNKLNLEHLGKVSDIVGSQYLLIGSVVSATGQDPCFT